jgi:hypothetical protein
MVGVLEAVEVPAGRGETVREAAPVTEALMMAAPLMEIDEGETIRCRDNGHHTRASSSTAVSHPIHRCSMSRRATVSVFDL